MCIEKLKMFYSCFTSLNFLATVKFHFMNDRQLQRPFKPLCNPIQWISVKETNYFAWSYRLAYFSKHF